MNNQLNARKTGIKMDISEEERKKSIERLLKNANEYTREDGTLDGQRQAILHTEGPLLIIAGPGTGKTKTLVSRIVYMVVEKGIDPASIMVVTFTKKAAKELLLRIQNALREVGVQINVFEMYIGTIHDVCLRLIEEHREKTRLKKNFQVAEEFMFNTLLYDAYQEEERLGENEISIKEEADAIALTELSDFGKSENGITSRWTRCAVIAKAYSQLKEELIDADDLIADDDSDTKNYGLLLKKIDKVIENNNVLTFSTILTECLNLLENHPDALAEIQEKIQYIMVDEYQDTNYIQEQIILKIAGERNNLCVVGDDDQSLYRFRGATVRNILRFESNPHFKNTEVKVVNLKINYRSKEKIVACYSEWQKNICNGYFDWETDRFDKNLEAYHDEEAIGVVNLSVTAEYLADEYGNQIYNEYGYPMLEDKYHLLDRFSKRHVDFIMKLKETGAITNYNQVAYLTYSFKKGDVVSIMSALEENGIPVYSPRSGLFFERAEVKLFLGSLCSCFANNFDVESETFINKDFQKYLSDCVNYYKDFIKAAESDEEEILINLTKEFGDTTKEDWLALKRFTEQKTSIHGNLTKNTDYGFTEVCYELLGQKVFKNLLEINPGDGVVLERRARNLASLINAVSKYEEYYDVEVLSPSKINYHVYRLFALYLSHMFSGGVDEYEDEMEYAPSGCVSFMTIHQSKGMEFPVVIAGALNRKPSGKENASTSDKKLQKIIEKYTKHEVGENVNNIYYYDFWRLYYVSFSRAKNLLALSMKDNGYSGNFSSLAPCFAELSRKIGAKEFDDKSIDLSTIKAESITHTDLMKTYSFTSKIGVYETCPKQYKYFKEYGFPEVGNTATLFGSLVHQTVEDIHIAAIENRISDITPENIETWARDNYRTLSSTVRGHLGEGQIQSAIKQVKKYMELRKNHWDKILATEVEVSFVDDNCILLGDVDLVEGAGDTVELVDFKTQASSELRNNPEWMEKYRRQLSMYAHLIHEKTGKKVSKTYLYCTKEDGNNDPTISFDVDFEQVQDTIAEFRKVVRKIECHDYSGKPKNKDTCKNCSMRWVCKD